MSQIIEKEDIRFTKLKDARKIVRSINQSLLLLLLLLILFRALFSLTVYEPYDPSLITGVDNGFLCLSYAGVDTVGSQSLISDERLEEHLQALKSSGYVTVSQQDVLNYLHRGEPLPERALLLMFSDGRRDTAVFAQKIMEEQNMLATMFTYADKFKTRDNKSLMAKEVKLLLDTTFWEMGTNGYRLSFINCFDRYGNYLGQLESPAFSRLQQYIDGTYNHYLMDYLRDAYGTPTETFEEMEARITGDYREMERLYSNEVGSMPPAYAIMHANTGAFGTNPKASAVNERELKRLFLLNFNRISHSVNNKETDPYDLTRLEPGAHWSRNHLLMRLWEDTGLPMAFDEGLADKAYGWRVLNGAAEFQQEELILTSLPNKPGTVKLTRRSFSDMTMHVRLQGNRMGGQRILIRADGDRRRGMALEITDNVLYLYNLQDGREAPKLLMNLDLHDGIVQPSAEEQRIRALQAEQEVTGGKQVEAKQADAALLEAQAQLDPDAAGDRRVQIWLSGRHLSVWIDDKLVIQHLDMGDVPESGFVYLESAADFSGENSPERDGVYDGRFRELYITDIQTDAILFDYRPDGETQQKLDTQRKWASVIDWFIKIL